MAESGLCCRGNAFRVHIRTYTSRRPRQHGRECRCPWADSSQQGFCKFSPDQRKEGHPQPHVKHASYCISGIGCPIAAKGKNATSGTPARRQLAHWWTPCSSAKVSTQWSFLRHCPQPPVEIEGIGGRYHDAGCLARCPACAALWVCSRAPW